MIITQFNTIIGEILRKVVIDKLENKVQFITNKGEEFLMFHQQDCCEEVYIDDINGDINDLIDSPILQASEVSSENTGHNYNQYSDDTWTWTFYNLSTIKGSVQIKWFGGSNGYYSEKVDFVKLK